MTFIENHVLLPDAPDWSTRPAFERIWQTESAAALPGGEKRSTVKDAPRIKLDWTVQLHTVKQSARFEHDLTVALKGYACAPLFGYGVTLTAEASSNTLTISTGAWPFAADQYVFLADWSDLVDQRFETAQILSVSGNTLTLTASLANTWPAGTMLWPIIFGKLTCKESKPFTSRHAMVNLSLTERIGSTFVGPEIDVLYDPYFYRITGGDIEVDGNPSVLANEFECVGGYEWANEGSPVFPPMPLVLFSPLSGEATVPVTVELSIASTVITGLVIRYTLDGSIPTVSSPVYTVPLVLAAETTLKARTFSNQGLAPGPLCAATYAAAVIVVPPVVKPPIVLPVDVDDPDNPGETIPVDAPLISGKTRFFNRTLVVITSGVTGGVIHYTTNGTTPTSGSATYSAPFTITASQTIKAIVVSAGQSSEVTALEFEKLLSDSVFSYVECGPDDKVGTYGWFAPNTDANDYHFTLVLDLAEETEVLSIDVYMVNAATGEWDTMQAWSTRSPLYPWPFRPAYGFYVIPLVVIEGSTQQNAAYLTTLGTFEAGVHNLDLYGQSLDAGAAGYRFKVLVRLSDGTEIQAMSAETT